MSIPISGAGLGPAVGAFMRSPEPSKLLNVDEIAEVKAGAAPGDQFISMLRAEINKVNSDSVNMDDRIREVTVGRSADIHGMMISITQADLSFRLMTQVRNKALEAYQEIMRMNL